MRPRVCLIHEHSARMARSRFFPGLFDGLRCVDDVNGSDVPNFLAALAGQYGPVMTVRLCYRKE